MIQLPASKVHWGRPVFEEEHAAYDLISRFSFDDQLIKSSATLAAATRTSEDSLRASEPSAAVGYERDLRAAFKKRLYKDGKEGEVISRREKTFLRLRDDSLGYLSTTTA